MGEALLSRIDICIPSAVSATDVYTCAGCRSGKQAGYPTIRKAAQKSAQKSAQKQQEEGDESERKASTGSTPTVISVNFV